MPTIVSTDVTSVTMPNFNMSESASMSEVWREITRPDVYRSWNERLSSWKCTNTRRRRSRITSWPTRPTIMRNALNVAAPSSVITTIATTTVTSGRMVPLPPFRSGGMPWSMPTCTSNGPASCAAVLHAMSTAARSTDRRCGAQQRTQQLSARGT